jgi:DNA-binding HxlR family transcriptional regulator
MASLKKKVTVGYPVTIEYQLLPYSHTLEELVGAMTKWGIQHREKIKSELSSGGATPSQV